MTENKRFIYAKSEGGVGYAIYDTTKTYTFPNLLREYEAKVFCRVLNELVDENEKLTKQLRDYKILVNDLSVQRDEFFNGAIENAEHNGKLQKENEQLKQENEELLKDIDRLVEVTGLGIDDIIYKYTEDV